MKYSFELQLCYYPLWCQFQFSSKMFLTFLLTELLFFWALQKEAGGWTGRDRQKEKDEKRSKYFPFILIYFHTLRITQRENKILVPHLMPMCTRTPPGATGICRKSTSLCITCSYFICYQDEGKVSFHFSPAHIHIKQIIEIYTILSLIILTQTGLSLPAYHTVEQNWLGHKEPFLLTMESLLGNGFVPVSQTLIFQL